MSLSSFQSGKALSSASAHNTTPRRLIVTASVAIFAVQDWTLSVLLRNGPWGPPMRLVLGTETVADAVERTLDALLLRPEGAPLLCLKAGWQEQQVSVWGSKEQGAAVSLIHSVLLRTQGDELRPNLHAHDVPSLRVGWTQVEEIESKQRALDAEVLPIVTLALHALRSEVQRNPEIVLRYLAQMDDQQNLDGDTSHPSGPDGARQGELTLAEAALLYKAFFPPDEQIDLSNLRRRFLATNMLESLDEERPVRGREQDWRRVSRVYRYLARPQ